MGMGNKIGGEKVLHGTWTSMEWITVDKGRYGLTLDSRLSSN